MTCIETSNEPINSLQLIRSKRYIYNNTMLHMQTYLLRTGEPVFQFFFLYKTSILIFSDIGNLSDIE